MLSVGLQLLLRAAAAWPVLMTSFLRVKKDVDKGTQHSDMFLLKPEEGGEGTAVLEDCVLGVWPWAYI